jgi:hypothetical protein
MFDITITGNIPHKRYIKKYARDVLTHFFKNRLKRDVPIKIKIATYLEGMQGLCYGSRNYINIEIALVINGKSNRKRCPSLDQILETLAHELVHAKQFLRGEINLRNQIWRGIRGPYDCKRVKYMHTPWEKEAYNQEKFLKELYWDKHYKQLIK